MGLLQRLGFSRKPEVITPEIAMIMQELDEELARDHELLADGLTGTSGSIGNLLHGFAQRCEKIASVGSYRRGKSKPGDVDILYVPKNKFQVVEFLEKAVDDEKQLVQFKPCWKCTIRGQKVDFIESTNASWGMDMIQFTGDREFNQLVVRHAERRGYLIENSRPVVTKKGTYTSYTEQAFDYWSEEKILNHLGLGDFLNPHTRETHKELIAVSVNTLLPGV